KRFYGAEGGTAREGDGGVARQFLLAFHRHFRVPRCGPEALARDRRRADHRESRSRLRKRKSARRAVAPGVWRTAHAGERGPHLGQRRSRSPRRGTGDRSPPLKLYRRPDDEIRTVGGLSPRPRANSLLGVSRLCVIGPEAAERSA